MAIRKMSKNWKREVLWLIDILRTFIICLYSGAAGGYIVLGTLGQISLGFYTSQLIISIFATVFAVWILDAVKRRLTQPKESTKWGKNESFDWCVGIASSPSV